MAFKKGSKDKSKGGHDFPEHLRLTKNAKSFFLKWFFRDFMQTIEIKEDLDDPKERARRAAEKRKQKEAEAAKANKIQV